MNKLFKTLLPLIIVLFSVKAGATQQPVLSHQLHLCFDLKNHRVQALDLMTIIPTGIRFNFLINRDFFIEKVEVEGKKVKFQEKSTFDGEQFGAGFEGGDSCFFQRAKMVQVEIKSKYLTRQSVTVEVRYSGKLFDQPSSAAFSRVSIADQTVGIIGEEGIYLSPEGLYHPWAGEGMSRFSVECEIPADYYIVTDGALLRNEISDNIRIIKWESSSPADGLYISGAKWEMRRAEYDGTTLYGFFFPEDSALSTQYVDAVKRYLGMYEGLFGDYAYPKFAVVENFFPTGYGMPSWTLLGQAVVRLPWIVNISLGHEVCHNWWGNGVFVDYKSGNWCEGLTTYSADYLYKERQSPSEARIYRRTVNQDFSAYVSESNDFPLRDFRAREETFTRAIGYGKSMMVFHMLRRMVGEENYWSALSDFYLENLFKIASWNDIQRAFENRRGENLNWFFGQWVDNKGAPILHLGQPELSESQGQYLLKFKLSVLSGNFRLYIPVVISGAGGEEETLWNYYESGVHEVALTTGFKPTSLAIDPDFEVFRFLDRDEFPPALAEVLGAERQIIVLPSKGDAGRLSAYRQAAEAINRSGEAKIALDSEVERTDLANNSYFIFGGPQENSLYKSFADAGLRLEGKLDFFGEDNNFNLKGESFSGPQVSCMVTLRNPLNRQQSLAFFAGSSAEEILRTGVKLIHYGKYSYLAFEEGKNVSKGNWETLKSPLRWDFE